MSKIGIFCIAARNVNNHFPKNEQKKTDVFDKKTQ